MKRDFPFTRMGLTAALLLILFGSSSGRTALPFSKALAGSAARRASDDFNFKKYLFGPPSTLSLFLESLDFTTGLVVINGAEIGQTTGPFTFNWGDGNENTGYFAQSHTYLDISQNYIVTVTSHYTDGSTDQAKKVVCFTSPAITPINLPDDIAVMIPDSLNTPPISRIAGYGISSNLTYFDDSFFPAISRHVIEYALTAAAQIQKDFTNDDTVLIDGRFEQWFLRDPTFGGMYALWYTDPVAFGVGDYALKGTLAWSSFMHEMGHNFTLNTPADYFYGGKIDGNANAIFSETMAQIYQHATGYELINRAREFGLSEDLTEEIKDDVITTMKGVRNTFDKYVSSGKPFTSWNDPGTSADDDACGMTLITIAYEFFKHAENDGMGYRIPLKRMMALLQTFDASMAAQYDQNHDTAAAATFRSTLMVAALSYAFSRDLRQEFRDLNFPIDDACYLGLYQKMEPLLTVTSPNGGEFWGVGSTHEIAWTTPAEFAEAKIEYSTNGGTDWTIITESAPGSKSVKPAAEGPVEPAVSSYAWTIPDDVSDDCLIRVSEAAAGTPNDTSDAVFSIVDAPLIGLSKTAFNFASVRKGKTTPADSVLITNRGSGTLKWTAASSAAWLVPAPKTGPADKTMKIKVVNAGKMAVGTYTGTITITDPGAANSPALISVTLVVKSEGTDAVPFGAFETPADGAAVKTATTIISGWALDDVGVKSARIYLKTGAAKKKLIGTAKFVAGARPDIETAFPAYPQNGRAGWSYTLSMKKLPGGGIGTFILMVFIKDLAGHEVCLGTHTITGVAPASSDLFLR